MPMTRYLWVLASIFTFAFGAASNDYSHRARAHDGVIFASRAQQAISPEVSALAQKLVDEVGVPGISVGVVRLGDRTVHTEYGSWGKWTEDGDAMQPETLFGIGSCSKAFLTTAIGILMDDFANGRNVTALPDAVSQFNWQTKVQALFPGNSVWKLQDEWATAKASIADLLSHQTGVTRHDFMYTSDDTPETLAPKYRYLKPNLELRQQWSYSNLFYIFGSLIVEKYSGMPYTEFVKKRIFVPLNMTSTTYSLKEAQESGHMSETWSQNGRHIPPWLEGVSESLIAGAGGIISNAVDMSKWAATYLNGGVDPRSNKTIFPNSVYAEVTTSRTIISGNVTGPTPTTSIVGYGLGWQRLSYQGRDVVYHDGGIPGFLSVTMFLPSDNLAIVGFINTDVPGDAQEIIPFGIIESVLGLNNTVGAVIAEDASFGPSDNPAISGNDCSNSTIKTTQFAGTYTNPGYGNITFCAPGGDSSSYCTSTLSDFVSVSPNGTIDPNAVYAKSPRLVDHFSMVRKCENAGAGIESFLLLLQFVYPNGSGRNATAFAQVARLVDVECVVDYDSAKVIGCGWMDSEEGPKSSVGSVQQRADVWFEKI